MKRSIAVAGLALTAISTPAALAQNHAGAANPLDGKSCEQLGVEREALVQLGVEKDMLKGPEWAKANLAPSDLNLIRLFIEIGERLKFRCAPAAAAVAGVNLQITQPDPVAAPAATPPPKPVLVPPLPVKRSAFAKPERPAPPSVIAPKPAAAKPKPAAPSAKKKDAGG